MPVRAFVKHFRSEFEHHIEHKRCLVPMDGYYEWMSNPDVGGRKAAKTPAGFWVEGFFHDDTKVKDGRPLTVDDLDKISTTHPVMVRHRGGHTVFVNSLALALAGVTRDTPNPPGGTFDRLPDGRLSGRITDNAIDLVEEKGQRPVLDAAEKAKRMRAGMAHISGAFSRYGLTTVHHQGGDLAATGHLQIVMIDQRLFQAGAAHQRAVIAQ
jgi:predicted amidohydrolase YtcJ